MWSIENEKETGVLLLQTSSPVAWSGNSSRLLELSLGRESASRTKMKGISGSSKDLHKMEVEGRYSIANTTQGVWLILLHCFNIWTSCESSLPQDLLLNICTVLSSKKSREGAKLNQSQLQNLLRIALN